MSAVPPARRNVDGGDGRRVAGRHSFFFSESLSGPWRHEFVTKRCPSMPRRHAFIAIKATSNHLRPKQDKGVFAMVYFDDLRWQLIVVDRLTRKGLWGWNAADCTPSPTGTSRKIDYRQFVYVGIYSRFFLPWSVDRLRALAVVNKVDGALETSLSPTILDFKEPGKKKKKRKGKRGRGGKFSKINERKLAVEWLTVFVRHSESVPYTDFLGSNPQFSTSRLGRRRANRDFIIVPHLEATATQWNYFKVRKHSIVPKKSLVDLDGLPPVGYHMALLKASLTTFDLVEVDSKIPFRIVLVTASEYNSLSLCAQVNAHGIGFKFKLSRDSNIALPGVTLSMSQVVPEVSNVLNPDQQICFQDCLDVRNSIQRSFLRKSTPHCGLLAMFGPRRSARVHLKLNS